MHRKRILLVFALIFCLAACAKTASPPENQPEAVPAAVQTVEKIDRPVKMYKGAVRDLLGNGDNFSWAQEYPPEMVMIHFCSAVISNPEDPYDLKAVRKTFVDGDVSIHYLIDREGTIYCYIPEDRVAWHAGPGQWQGIEKYKNNLNRYSIGIELMAIGSYADMSIYMTKEQYDALDPTLIGYTDAQYEALAVLVADICQRHEIPLDRDHVIGHEEYASQKNDPGELFDWSRIIP